MKNRLHFGVGGFFFKPLDCSAVDQIIKMI
jgi:hypothetical protein